MVLDWEYDEGPDILHVKWSDDNDVYCEQTAPGSNIMIRKTGQGLVVGLMVLDAGFESIRSRGWYSEKDAVISILQRTIEELARRSE